MPGFFVKLVRAKGELGWGVLIGTGMPRELCVVDYWWGRKVAWRHWLLQNRAGGLLKLVWVLPSKQGVHRGCARHQSGQDARWKKGALVVVAAPSPINPL